MNINYLHLFNETDKKRLREFLNRGSIFKYLPSSSVKSVRDTSRILLEDLVVDHNKDDYRDEDGGE